jgi:beta-glucosidase
LDIARDARWGRIHETFGEDPYLISAMGAEFVKGLQGPEHKEGVISTAKHFLGYSLAEGGLNLSAAHIGERELYEVFARPFEAAIKEADLAAAMTSYSDINGIPCGASQEIVTGLLREKMGFKGFVVSDGAALRKMVTAYGIARDMQEAGIHALEAGLDAEMPVGDGFKQLPDSVAKGLVDPSLIDRAVERVLKAKFEYGLFENPYAKTERIQEIYTRSTSKKIAAKLAEDSMVLLKNQEGILPLKTNIKSVALIGPHADSTRCMFSGYTNVAFSESKKVLEDSMKNKVKQVNITFNGLADELAKDNAANESPIDVNSEAPTIGDIEQIIRKQYKTQSIKEAVAAWLPQSTIYYAKGCGITELEEDGILEAVEAARKAEVVIMALGGKGGWVADCTYGEGKDQALLDLPGVQQKLLEAVAATGTPIIAVLFNGGPYSVTWADEHIDAILQVWHPGEGGGAVIADTLFGKVNPGGKLPITFPRSVGQVPQYYYHKAGSGYKDLPDDTAPFFGKGYVNEKLGPLYPFGYGLSYTQFEYEEIAISDEKVDANKAVLISCKITNKGNVAGDEVVQLYCADRKAKVTRPIQQLTGFKRVSLQPGEACRVTFKLPMSLLAFYNQHMEFVVEPGQVKVMIGSSSDDIRLNGSFEIVGRKENVFGKRKFSSTAKVEFDQ